jgi:LysM repeat protein
VVPRKPKLIAAAAVLAVGFGLAWPWRRGDSVPASVLPISQPSSSFGSVAAPFVEGTSASASITVSATTIGLAGTPPPSELASASSLPQAVTVAKPVQVEPGQFALSGIEPTEALSAAARERTYIVQEGDSLERLAQRYLGDEGRAIELFDLNRQVLENPHLLPIGAELKIPIGVDSTGTTNAE